MAEFKTDRLLLKPIDAVDYDRFIRKILTDERVVTYYYSYQGLDDLEIIKQKAQKDFWDYFERARKNGLEIWAAYGHDDGETLVGWCGMVLSELTERYGGVELQYMLAGDFHGKGLATEFAQAVLNHAHNELGHKYIIATIDIPNKGSIRVIEKLGFTFKGQIEAYGSTEMYFYEKYSE